MKRWRRAARALRFQDWGVQLLIHWGAALALAVGSGLTGARLAGPLAWTTALVAMGMCAGYLVNNVADHEPDQHKPRPYFEGKRERRGAATLAALLIVGAVLIAHGFAETIWVVLIAWLQVGLGLAYSLPPIRLKERGVWGLLTAATTQRLPAYGMLAVSVSARPAVAWAVAAWLFVVGLVFIVEHQLEDLASDLESGTRTWVTEAGRARGWRLRCRAYDLHHLGSACLALFVAAQAGSPGGAVGATLFFAAALLLSFVVQRHYALNRAAAPLAARPGVV